MIMAIASPLPPPDSSALYAWLQVAFMLLAAAALAMTVFRRQPPISAEIDAKIEKALRPFETRLDTLEGNFIALRTQIESQLQNIQKSGEERASKIHRRIDVVAENLARTEGELSAVAANVEKLLSIAMERGQS